MRVVRLLGRPVELGFFTVVIDISFVFRWVDCAVATGSNLLCLSYIEAATTPGRLELFPCVILLGGRLALRDSPYCVLLHTLLLLGTEFDVHRYEHSSFTLY